MPGSGVYPELPFFSQPPPCVLTERELAAQQRCQDAFQVPQAARLQGIVHGGDEGARTPDLDSAIVALSQLSYIPRQARS